MNTLLIFYLAGLFSMFVFALTHAKNNNDAQALSMFWRSAVVCVTSLLWPLIMIAALLVCAGRIAKIKNEK